jgi:hypothetical protein
MQGDLHELGLGQGAPGLVGSGCVPVGEPACCSARAHLGHIRDILGTYLGHICDSGYVPVGEPACCSARAHLGHIRTY